RGLANEHVKDPVLTFPEISSRLGFAHTTAFYRAFKRWCGIPPARYRATTRRTLLRKSAALDPLREPLVRETLEEAPEARRRGRAHDGPEAHVGVAAAGCERTAVRRYGEAEDGCGVTLEHAALARIQIPDLNGAVAACGSQSAAVREERE